MRVEPPLMCFKTTGSMTSAADVKFVALTLTKVSLKLFTAAVTTGSHQSAGGVLAAGYSL